GAGGAAGARGRARRHDRRRARAGLGEVRPAGRPVAARGGRGAPGDQVGARSERAAEPGEEAVSGLDAREQRVVAAIEAGREELVALLSELIGFDTTARVLGDPARDEAALQEHIGSRLGARGAEVDIWEPPAAETPPGPQIPEGIEFAGRPQLAARFAGSGGGRSLIFNGHIDVVEASPVEAWTSHPNHAEVRDGRV